MPGLKVSASVLAAVGLVLGGFAGSALAAGDRLAVLIVADQDPALSDNLTEVAISKLAERREHRLVGWPEVHDQLADVLDGQGIADCLEKPQCLARIGATAQVDSALIGEVRREDDRFTVRLILVNTGTAVREAEFSESVAPDIAQLISAVRRGVAAVSTPKPASLTLRPADAQAAPQTDASLAESPMVSVVQTPRQRARWVAPLGYAAGGLAVVSLSAAVVTGIHAEEKPIGATRAQAQSDLEQRDRYAGIANGLYLAAGVLAVTAVITLVTQLRHD